MAIPSLIVGAGPVGLAASILLSRYGVRTTLVERRREMDPHPRARSISRRTMEIFRGFGIAEELRQRSLPPVWTREQIYATTLSGPEIGRVASLDFESAPRPDLSPAVPLMSSQDRLEPLLRSAAEGSELATVRFGCEARALSQDGDGVTVTLVDHASGEPETIRAAYVIAADGAGSSLRKQLGIRLEGQLQITTVVDVHFTADLRRYVDHRPAWLYWVDTRGGAGVFQPLDGNRAWRCQIGPSPELGPARDFTPQMCVEWIHAAIGEAGATTELKILGVRPWAMHAATAKRFREGRVFLAGDAAHVLPPTGGLGMNSGVQGIYNLAWKLAAVVKGYAGPSLLDTYELEHRPVVERNAKASLENMLAVRSINAAYQSRGDVQQALAHSEQYGNYAGLDLGVAYPDGALMPDGSEPPEIEDPVRDYTPTARPGHRAPHVELTRTGSELSTLDLFGAHFTLLAAAGAGDWAEAARELADKSSIPLDVHRFGAAGDLQTRGPEWEAAYGVATDGAVLVRPDGHVAWRSATGSAHPLRELQSALDQILTRE